MEICNPNHSAYIAKITNVRNHSNADRLKLGTVLGNNVIVGLDVEENTVGIYFQSGLAVSKEYGTANDLFRRKDPVTGEHAGGMLEDTGRIKSQRLRGEMSDGLFMPLSSLTIAGVSIASVNTLAVGDFFQEIDNVKICDKYIPVGSKTGTIVVSDKSNKQRKRKKPDLMFKEHYDTTQLNSNLHNINLDDYITITEKVHGTSQRVGNVKEVTVFSGIVSFICRLLGVDASKTVWLHKIGTRRTTVSLNRDGYYAASFRRNASDPFLDKLHKGETIYYEVAGYEGERPIMGIVDTSKLDKEFIKKYGKKMVFSYGCEPGNFAIFVYRITMTNEDGTSIDLPWDALVARCEALGVNHVPLLYKGTVRTLVEPIIDLNKNSLVRSIHEQDAAFQQTYILNAVQPYVEGVSTIDPRHIREGVVVKIEGSMQPKAYKHKSFEFKVLEGIVKPETASIDQLEEL